MMEVDATTQGTTTTVVRTFSGESERKRARAAADAAAAAAATKNDVEAGGGEKDVRGEVESWSAFILSKISAAALRTMASVLWKVLKLGGSVAAIIIISKKAVCSYMGHESICSTSSDFLEAIIFSALFWLVCLLVVLIPQAKQKMIEAPAPRDASA